MHKNTLLAVNISSVVKERQNKCFKYNITYLTLQTHLEVIILTLWAHLYNQVADELCSDQTGFVEDSM